MQEVLVRMNCERISIVRSSLVRLPTGPFIPGLTLFFRFFFVLFLFFYNFIKQSALYARAALDAHSHRTIERGALQIQALVDQYSLQSNADDASTTPISEGKYASYYLRFCV